MDITVMPPPLYAEVVSPTCLTALILGRSAQHGSDPSASDPRGIHRPIVKEHQQIRAPRYWTTGVPQA
jgi:hypothetical protein